MLQSVQLAVFVSLYCSLYSWRCLSHRTAVCAAGGAWHTTAVCAAGGACLAVLQSVQLTAPVSPYCSLCSWQCLSRCTAVCAADGACLAVLQSVQLAVPAVCAADGACLAVLLWRAVRSGCADGTVSVLARQVCVYHPPATDHWYRVRLLTRFRRAAGLYCDVRLLDYGKREVSPWL